MRKGRIAYIILTFLLAVGCSGRRGEVTLRIVATSDVHGQIFDKDCLDGTERRGSLAKFSTFLNGQRKEYRNVIYLDAGDAFQGSVEMYQDISAQFDRPSLVAQAYNLLGCEAMACGNHDLAIGIPYFEEIYDQCSFPILGANVCFVRYGDYLPRCRILEVKGVKVAILGLTTPTVKYSIPRDQIGDLDSRDIVEAARYFIPILRDEEKVDVVVGLIHSGFEGGSMDAEGVYEQDIKRLVSEVPGFDVIIFGHDHSPRELKLADANGDSVLLLNPGPYAMNAAVATVTVDFRDGDTPKVLTSGCLKDITSEVPDTKFMEKLSGWYDDVKHYSDSVVGRVSIPIEGKGVLWRGSSAMDYVHSKQIRFGGADISLSSPLFTKALMPAGDVRIHDLFELYQYDNTMVTVLFKGSEIRDILEYSAGLFYNTVKDKGDNLLKLKTDGNGSRVPEYAIKNLVTAVGIDYVVDVSKPQGQRVKVLSMTGGKPFDPDRLYRTTINSFLYGSGESAVFKATGLSRKDMLKRLDISSSADVRYYMITDFALSQESGREVRFDGFSNWKLIPEPLVEGCLARDTINFSVLNERTTDCQ